MDIKAVFLDIDNTLLDFNECARVALRAAMEKMGERYRDDMYPVFEKENNQIWKELEFSDAGFKVEVTDTDSAKKMLPEDSRNVIDMLYLFPNGFKNRSMVIEGLTTVSLKDGGSVVIDGLTVGESYTVTEIGGGSNRYTADQKVKSITLKANPDNDATKNLVVFTNELTNNKWLTASDVKHNVFN